VRIGIFGGTFDPPHLGHLIVARDACEQLRLDRVLFVPARRPPHKLDQAVSEADVRLAMLTAATAADPQFEICELELNREGPSYTVETLRELRAERAGDAFYLLLGADQVRELATWKAPEEIARLCSIVLLSREGVGQAGHALVSASIEVTRIGISSTNIRERVANGRSIRYLVPAAVEEIITSRGLYRTGATRGGKILDSPENERA
jgi:nicotinate-nucleotide adenylyltransferase